VRQKFLIVRVGRFSNETDFLQSSVQRLPYGGSWNLKRINQPRKTPYPHNLNNVDFV
jgi:hypothetical protein